MCEGGHRVTSSLSPGLAAQQECSAGYYATDTESALCLPAPPGHFVATNGAIESLPCAAGRYTPFAGSSSCALTPAGTYAPEGATAPIACPAGTEARVEGLGACVPAVKPPTPGVTQPAPTPQPGPAVGQPALRCTLTAVAKQLSLSHTGKQAYSLNCNLAGRVNVSAVVTITSGKRHVKLTVPALSIPAAAGLAGKHLLHVKLTKVAGALLKRAKTRVSLAISVSGSSAGASPTRLNRATLAGHR